MIPLFFQVVLLDSASKAGVRLIIPSLATPIGGLIAGFIMSRWGQLGHLVRLGCFLMMLGNALVASLQYYDSSWKYVAYLFPANLGQGIVYPSILFTNIAAFEQSRKCGFSGPLLKKKRVMCNANTSQSKLCRPQQSISSGPWEPSGVWPRPRLSSRISSLPECLTHCPEYQIKRK
jgi:hypothetical protein